LVEILLLRLTENVCDGPYIGLNASQIEFVMWTSVLIQF